MCNSQQALFVAFRNLAFEALDAVLFLGEIICILGDGDVLLSVDGHQSCGIIASMLKDLEPL